MAQPSPTTQTEPPIEPAELADVFRRAAHVIAIGAADGRPLCRGWYQDPTGTTVGHCALGAIYAVIGVPVGVQHPLADAAIELLGARLPAAPRALAPVDDATARVAAWHDEPGRTAAEVVAGLLHAAADAAPPAADAAHLAAQRHDVEDGPETCTPAVTQ